MSFFRHLNDLGIDLSSVFLKCIGTKSFPERLVVHAPDLIGNLVQQKDFEEGRDYVERYIEQMCSGKSKSIEGRWKPQVLI